MVSAINLGRAILTGSLWYDNVDASPLEIATDIAATYFIYQPLTKPKLVGHAAKSLTRLSWPVVAGYLAAGAAGYVITRSIWGESGSDDFMDYWTDPFSLDKSPLNNASYIFQHYSREAMSEVAPVVSQHPAHRRYSNPFIM